MTTNPLKIGLRKATLKKVFLAAVVVLAVQVGVLVHYVVQTNQVAELEELREELSQSRGQTVAFSEAIDDMRQRMLSMQEVHAKLQTMFGLDHEQRDGLVVDGQGGEEFPYDASFSRATGRLSEEAPADELIRSNPNASRSTLVVKIEKGLVWLDRQALRQRHVLARLEETAEERVERWAATPSIWPVKGPVTSKFGPRISPFTGKKAFHSGLDIGSPRGKEVRAPAAGRVAVAAYDTRMGNFIRINHGYGIETTYGHLLKTLVKYGQRVKRGDLIGLVGSTGRFSTGPHLHYQIAIQDTVVNPRQYILD